jgi:hypothetical protein
MACLSSTLLFLGERGLGFTFTHFSGNNTFYNTKIDSPQKVYAACIKNHEGILTKNTRFLYYTPEKGKSHLLRGEYLFF